MNLVASTLKITVGLVVFASLMMLEFNSYTRAVAEEVNEPVVTNSQTPSANAMAITVKKSSKVNR